MNIFSCQEVFPVIRSLLIMSGRKRALWVHVAAHCSLAYSCSMQMLNFIITVSQSTNRRRPANSKSLLLNDDENARLLSALGPEAVCLSAGVAELLRDNGLIC